ncbi:SUN domain-containing protein 1 isoform X12 [Ursus arctos]|uniref:SUN domain-containing protein 1 isoform X12 n=2 Tax=Ursus arctos TaxID=9644 RepID=UPI0025488E41|nr:SUN domain-containing protein 1 isoform X12 [Ursus arctos]XP_057171631.1 SUN domain-containing protein 1 isoform X12 [Ursus arctos]XP_057171632.1 SUN domain-containing protein 1 isoform X12 [Ursus arctos]XP_057171633.1 SUN domain-containing protein 1 isoform X12 [Ursus arctos]XP_057171635.1 SUN domain-containing protein 1 isoform X12 [Ursus arctos]
MDFSRLHMYTPPQCVPENTGYTYALSSSYSSDALAFETEHRLDPVFDSPRMSRRSLRLVTTACAVEDGQAGDARSCISSTASLKDRVARAAKQRRSVSKPALSVNHTSRKVVACAAGQSAASTLSGAACLRPPVLDESLIREQTKVDHFWGLDDDGDLKGGNKAATQGNGDLAAEGTRSNGYTCSDCLLLSERKDTLTAHSAPRGTSPRLYSRDTGQKHESVSLKGKAASGIFWWLGIGWYQFVTLISWLNVFLLTRCLRNICKFLLLLVPLLLLLAAGVSLCGQGDFLSGLPVLNWTRTYGAQRVDGPESTFTPGESPLSRPLEDGDEAFRWFQRSEVERQLTSLSGQCRSHDEKLRELAAVLQKLQARVDQMDGDSEATLSLVQRVVGQHLKEMGADRLSGSQTDTVSFHQEHELRLSNLEDVLGKLTEKSEAIRKELEQTKLRTASGAEEERYLLSMVKRLELELGQLKSELSSWQHLKTSCEEVDTIHGKANAQVRETIKRVFSGEEQGGSLERLLQTVSSRFVSKDDLQALLRDLELQILKNVTHYISVTTRVPGSETVVSAAKEAGISGITEAQARVIVNNALKLYSQDKTGMVDFALESGGGSVLSTRCSETYETKTALISLFGIPLWYFSQSPRVVIQPDIHPGNCWAFRGSQGYLVVRLSMKIRPTTFTLEHIPKTLSPTGNITSAPKDFAVYGLENEYQEEGQLLGQFMYDQEGESLQMFHVLERPDGTFQIVELRILSNWGHPEYTCLYRFRVHGEPVK